jgi:peptide subunit release factor 1 (eRF1)
MGHFYIIFIYPNLIRLVAPKDQISRVAKMLADEYGTASNIKSRVNRLSVLGAITSTQQRLKLYNKGKLDPVFPVTERRHLPLV